MDFTEEEARGIIRLKLKEEFESQAAAAEETGVQQPHISAAINGGAIPNALFEYFGFRKQTVFRLSNSQ